MKEVNWGAIHGEGTIDCACDYCGKEHEFEFDGGYPDFKECQAELRSMGWMSFKLNGEWYDACCEECRNRYIKENS